MTNTIGRVNFTASIDGRKTPKDAENVGRKAGAAAADGYDETWSKSFRDTLSESGKRSFNAWEKAGRNDGAVYGKELGRRLESYVKTSMKNLEGLRLDAGFLDNFAKGFEDAGLAAGELQKQIATLEQETSIHGSTLNAARRQLDEWAASQRQAAADTNILADQTERHAMAMDSVAAKLGQDAQSRENVIRTIRDHNYAVLQQNSIWRDSDTISGELTRRLDNLSKSTGGLSLQWSDLSHNTRQWTLIIGAVMAGLQDIAVLGSAAGGGLLALGGAANAAVGGIGGMAAIFVTLNKDVEDLPENLREVATEFKSFTGVFGELRGAIAEGAFPRLNGVFTTLRGNLSALTPAMESLGASSGRVLRDLANNTKPGTDAFEELEKAVRLAGPNFEDLAGSAGTFGVALLRGVNRAQPVVEDLTDWVERLVRQFDAFTKSRGFDEWMRNTQRVFGSLGPLLDATGRALNDLVTAESVNRTTAFLDNLTGFMPNLTRLLDVLGKLDVFGLAAQALNEFGVALEPLAGPMGDLALALSQVASIGLTQFADVLTTLVPVLVPVAQGFADFLAALPPDVISGVANGVVVLAGAFFLLKGARGIEGLVASLGGLLGPLGKVESASGKLSTVLGRAGLVGAFVATAVAMPEIIGLMVDYADSISGIDAAVAGSVRANESFLDSLNKVNPNLKFTADGVLTLTDAISDAGGDWTKIDKAIEGFGNTAVQAEYGAGQLARGMEALDDNLSGLPLDQATTKFSAWAESLGANDEQIAQMIDLMPGFKAQLEAAAGGAGELVTQQDLLNLALGATPGAASGAAQGLAGVGGAARGSGVDIDDLASKIRGFAEATLNSRDANRQFEEAVDTLSESIKENGTTLDITTAAGRANESALDAIATAALEASASTLENTGSQEAANTAISAGRDRLIEMLAQLGITGAEAETYANKLGLIPENIVTKVTADTAAAQAGIDRFVRLNDGRTIRIYTDGRFDSGKGTIQGYASGGTLFGPQRILAGEAGPEAIVPLNRNLAQVDPSVRWLSAIAQGKGTTPSMARGGTAGGGAQVNVAEGAIVVQEAGDARRSANEVIRRLVEDVVG